MKIAIATLSIFAAVTSASLFDSVLTLAGPLIQKTKCAVPCIYGAGNKIPCGAQGPFATICDNAQGIYTESKSCVAQCGVDDKVGRTYSLTYNKSTPC